MILDDSGHQIDSGSQRMHVAREMKVDVIAWDDGRLQSSDGSAFDSPDRA